MHRDNLRTEGVAVSAVSTPLHSVAYDLSDEDVIALHKRLMRTSALIKSVRRKNILNGVIAWCSVVAGFAGVSYAIAPSHAAGLQRVVFWVVLYTLIAPFYAWRQLTPRAAFRKLDDMVERGVRTGKIPVTRGPVEVQLYDDHLVIAEADGTLMKPWSAITDVASEPDAIYFTFSDASQLRIPTRAFPDVSAEHEFIAAAQERLTREM
jgi:hypothetical protein